MDDFYGNGCRLAARENCVKNRGEPQLWFMHKADFREGQQAPRIRPEAREIVEKNSVHVSTACLAGFADRTGDSNQMQEEMASVSRRRLRTAEADTIASRLRNPQEEWFDFEGNQKLQLKPKPPRVGTSEIAAEFMRQQNRGSDWFTPVSKPVSGRDVPRMCFRPSTAADLRASSSNWFAHPVQAAGRGGEGENNCSNGPLRKNLRRVREEGFEYAERNRVSSDFGYANYHITQNCLAAVVMASLEAEKSIASLKKISEHPINSSRPNAFHKIEKKHTYKGSIRQKEYRFIAS
ncbi:unnamed protein product [Schistocephalus solidus]|uniref:Uncharacterized protein n=1 Tax=Schistocephalus solidus TaxID=70667 RepID=A0A183SYQ3_SCHSO|nr:unnamed protein product [Schistocephalus solidus]